MPHKIAPTNPAGYRKPFMWFIVCMADIDSEDRCLSKGKTGSDVVGGKAHRLYYLMTNNSKWLWWLCQCSFLPWARIRIQAKNSRWPNNADGLISNRYTGSHDSQVWPRRLYIWHDQPAWLVSSGTAHACRVN
jgi:hypothetical protein